MPVTSADRQLVNADPAVAAMVRRVYWASFAGVTLWLLLAALTVNIDFDDGYSTIANSQSLLGITKGYFWQRGPAMAAFLMPAEWIANRLQLPAFDVRIHHLLMAGLHALYLLGTWRLLLARFGARPEVMLAFVAALLTPVFFSYAPFISHDIFPGLLTLLMLRLAADYIADGGQRRWLLLVGIGCVLPAIKQTYALVWVAIVIAHMLLPEIDPDKRRQTQLRVAKLLLGALISGFLTWLIYASVTAEALAPVAFWLRPLKLVSLVMGHYADEGGAAQVMYQWIYLRNLSAYGILAMVLLLPGLYLSLRRGDRLQRSAAVVVILLLCAMQAIAAKEVRYLAFLAPVYALVLVPVMATIWKLRAHYRWALLALLLVDVARNVPEAWRLTAPYYRDAVTGFLEPLPASAGFAGKVIVERPLSFVSPEADAYFGDRYHRITHIAPDQIRLLYGYSDAQWLRVEYSANLDRSVVAVGDHLVMATDIALRTPPFRPGNVSGLSPNFLEAIGVAEWIELELNGDFYAIVNADPGSPHMLLRDNASAAAPMIGFDKFDVGAIQTLLALQDRPQHIRALGFRMLTLCGATGCQRFAIE